jgi:hypothetical protein
MTEKRASNNPAGRTRGTGVVAALRKELLSDGKVTALFSKVYDLGMTGNLVAARLILDRAMPPLRAQAATVSVTLPAGTFTDKALALLDAAAGGHVAPDIASELITALSRIVTIEQGTELKARLDALELSGYA